MVTSLAQKDQILSLLQDPYANYVVQRALQVSKLLLSCSASSSSPLSSFFLPSLPYLLLRCHPSACLHPTDIDPFFPLP